MVCDSAKVPATSAVLSGHFSSIFGRPERPYFQQLASGTGHVIQVPLQCLEEVVLSLAGAAGRAPQEPPRVSSNRPPQPSAPVGRISFEPPIFDRNCCQYGLILSAETACFNLTKHNPAGHRDQHPQGAWGAASSRISVYTILG